MGKQPKVHTVYDSAEAGLHDVLDAAVKDEPTPTPRAAELIQEAKHAGPVVPGGDGGLPTLAGGDGAGDLVGPAPVPGPTPRQSAENLIELAFGTELLLTRARVIGTVQVRRLARCEWSTSRCP